MPKLTFLNPHKQGVRDPLIVEAKPGQTILEVAE